MTEPSDALRAAYRRHERKWADNLYVYAVISRRSHGVSVGVNLNPGKGCNFNCIYCQVDRAAPPRTRTVNLERLAAELDTVLTAAIDGSLFNAPPFSALPDGQRMVRDIAFSGDGEPTAFARFTEAVEIAAAARQRFHLDSTKIVLITDAAYLAKPKVREALAALDRCNGEIWAKLDAGTEERFRFVNRANVTLQHVLDGILDAARARPVVIQSLWMLIDGRMPSDDELRAFCDRLNALREGGGRLTGVQIYTIARRPAEPRVTPIPDAQLDALAAFVRERVDVEVEVFYGVAG